jgi:hypothetical protein
VSVTIDIIVSGAPTELFRLKIINRNKIHNRTTFRAFSLTKEGLFCDRFHEGRYILRCDFILFGSNL